MLGLVVDVVVVVVVVAVVGGHSCYCSVVVVVLVVDVVVVVLVVVVVVVVLGVRSCGCRYGGGGGCRSCGHFSSDGGRLGNTVIVVVVVVVILVVVLRGRQCACRCGGSGGHSGRCNRDDGRLRYTVVVVAVVAFPQTPLFNHPRGLSFLTTPSSFSLRFLYSSAFIHADFSFFFPFSSRPLIPTLTFSPWSRFSPPSPPYLILLPLLFSVSPLSQGPSE